MSPVVMVFVSCVSLGLLFGLVVLIMAVIAWRKDHPPPVTDWEREPLR